MANVLHPCRHSVANSDKQVLAGFENADGKISVLNCGSGQRKIAPVESTRLATVLTGSVTIHSDDGQKERFKAGDLFSLPALFRGLIETHEPARLLCASFVPTQKVTTQFVPY